MYPRLESYPVTASHPVDPQHQILHYPLTKSAVLSSQASIQVTFPRPTLFIPSSRSSSHSSGSSPDFPTEDANQHPISVTKPSVMSSQQPPSFSNRVLPQGRPLPQVPPLPLSLAPIQPSVTSLSHCGGVSNPSPITSPSSPTTLHRPKRALPIIPPSPRTPHMTGHLSDSPATPPFGLSDPPSISQAAPAEHLSKVQINLSVDLSSTTATIHHLPPLRQHSHPRTRVAVRRVNAEASSSKVQLPPRSPVSLDDLLQPLPPPRPKLTVQTPPLTRTATDHSRRESYSKDRPKLRIQTPLTEPDSASFNRARQQLPQRVQPLPRVPIQTESTNRVPALPRRSSLDSLTTRSSALLSPGQALSPYVSKRPRSRRYSRNPQVYGSSNADSASGPAGVSNLGITEAKSASRNDQGPGHGGDAEPISPMKFVRDNSDEEFDEGEIEYRWNETSSGRGSHFAESPATQDGVLILSNSAILNSTADEVIDKRLDRIRRRHGDTVIRAFGVDPRVPLENAKGKGRAHGVGRFVLSEGEEGETDDEDDFYRPSPRPAHRLLGDYQNYVSDLGYGYGHEQAQEIPGQPEVYGNPHFIGTAYEYHQAAEDTVDIIDDEDSDQDASGDADNKTPAAMFPPRSVPGAFSIEDEMVFEKPVDDLDEDEEYLYKERRVVTNARSLVRNEPVSSDSDLALGGYASRGGSFQTTPPTSSRENATSRGFMKHMLRRSGATQSLSSEKFGATHSPSSSSSSFITPPPSSFQDLAFQQVQGVGPPVSIKKHFGRRWFREKGEQKWEERDYEEVIGSLKKSA